MLVVAANLDHYSQFAEWLRTILSIHTIQANPALKEAKAIYRLSIAG